MALNSGDPGWDDVIIAEFRANQGEVHGNIGAPLLLLHTTGRKTGQQRVLPLEYRPAGAGWAVFASNAGNDHNPGWYHNLAANPAASIEVGADTVAVTARELIGDERSAIWEQQKQDFPAFAQYEQQTERTIAVVLLTRR